MKAPKVSPSFLCPSILVIWYHFIEVINGCSSPTGGIEKFSPKENFRKILKVNHFYLGFSSNKKP